MKSIIQTQSFVGSSPKYEGMFHCFATVYKDAGWRGFTKGYAATVLRAIPASAAGFAVYELAQKVFPSNETMVVKE